MKRLSLLVGGFLIAGLLACSGESGSNLPVEADECPQAGTRTCGLTDAGTQAVLVCGSAPLVWEVAEVCAASCIFDSVLGATCESRTEPDVQEPEDLADDLPEPPVDAVDQELTDVPLTDAEPDTGPQEVVFPDLMPDLTPPWVESTNPEDDEMGVAPDFVVSIQFTEPMHAVTVEPKTVRMVAASGKEVDLQFAWADADNTLLQLTPTSAMFHSSPYTVILDPDIRDKAGNSMGNTYSFTFYTQALPTLESYAQLAGKYAPLIYQETYAQSPQYDYPTRYDLDDDWVAEDNVDFIKGAVSKIEPAVYYSVTETKSHFFITYAFFYPYRYAEQESNRFGNDVSGALVVVRKNSEAPVAVETYFKQGTDERSFAFLTDESGLLPQGKTYTQQKFDGMLPAATLFPGNRYTAWLSARKHESCLWLDENNGFLDGCILNAGIKASMQKMEYTWKNGAVDLVQKEGGKFPAAKANVGYGLIHLLESWWPRRSDLGPGQMWSSEFDYEPEDLFAGRPNLSTKIPSSFIDPIGNDNGRPPWAWKHLPGNGSSYFNMNRGVWFLDPAVHFKLRHDPEWEWADYDTQSGTGWSMEYCFNPYFNLDFRGIWPECTGK
jgi:hypothetical protein